MTKRKTGTTETGSRDSALDYVRHFAKERTPRERQLLEEHLEFELTYMLAVQSPFWPLVVPSMKESAVRALKKTKQTMSDSMPGDTRGAYACSIGRLIV